MNTFRSIFVDTAYQIAVDILCHKRNHRSCCLRDGHQSCIQCHISIDFILGHTFCPETLPAPSDIPVAHLIHKILQRSRTLRNPVVFQILIHTFYYRIQLRQQPFVHNRQLVIIQSIFCRIKFINIRVQHEKCVGIPQSTHEFTLAFHNRFSMETVRQPWSAVHIEIPADCVCTVISQRVKRVNRIAFGFAHLLSILILHMSQNDYILIWSFVEDQS